MPAKVIRYVGTAIAIQYVRVVCGGKNNPTDIYGLIADRVIDKYLAVVGVYTELRFKSKMKLLASFASCWRHVAVDNLNGKRCTASVRFRPQAIAVVRIVKPTARDGWQLDITAIFQAYLAGIGQNLRLKIVSVA